MNAIETTPAETYRVIRLTTTQLLRVVAQCSKLEGNAQLLAFHIVSVYDFERGVASISRKKLAKRMHCGSTTVGRALAEIKNAECPEIVVIPGRGGQYAHAGSMHTRSRYFISAAWVLRACAEMNAESVASNSKRERNETAASILAEWDERVFTINRRGARVVANAEESQGEQGAQVELEEADLSPEDAPEDALDALIDFEDDDLEDDAQEPEKDTQPEAPVTTETPDINPVDSAIASPIEETHEIDATPIFQAVTRARGIERGESTVAYLRKSGTLGDVMAAVDAKVAIAGKEAVVSYIATSLKALTSSVGFEAMPAWLISTTNALPAPPVAVLEGLAAKRTVEEINGAWARCSAEHRAAAEKRIIEVNASGFDAKTTIADSIEWAKRSPEEWAKGAGLALWIVEFAMTTPLVAKTEVNAGAWEKSSGTRTMTVWDYEALTATEDEDGEVRW